MAAFAEFRILWSMTMTVGSPKLLSPAEIRQFLKGSEGIDFAATERSGLYRWFEQTLQRYRYSGQSKEARGVLREFLVKMTGWRVPQVTRLIGQYLRTGQVREKEYGRHRFARQYRPGYIRIDTVHQPERDGEKSVYHINAIDEVTQWEVLGCVPTISEHDLIPALKAMLQQFPFRLRGFHSDNGSEYVNDPTASLLEKLRAEFTKSRPRRSNHNALVETKNGAVVPKNIGYQWLPPSHADDGAPRAQRAEEGPMGVTA